MSAHVWYRGALTQLHHGETLVETHVVPEQASFGSVASNENKSSSSSSSVWSDGKDACCTQDKDLEENDDTFQEEMISWDWACSFLPVFSSASTEMVTAPETAIGSIPISELVTNHDTDDTKKKKMMVEPTTLHHDHLISKMTNPFNTNDASLWVLHQPESALGAICVQEMVDDIPITTTPTTDTLSTTTTLLPRTLQEYYEMSLHDERAMVVTRAQSPHVIVDVNDAWVGLCGYTRGQAVDKSLGELLQGEDTVLNPDFVKRLRQGKEATTVVVNYDVNGRKFINRVHAGPLKNNEHDDVVTHFVGVLQELKQQEEEEQQEQHAF
jgi:PAS domain S-box-containing protein